MILKKIYTLVAIWKYKKAKNKGCTVEKKEWLDQWTDTRLTWKQIGYLYHVPYLMFQYPPNLRTPFLNTNNMGFRGKEDYSYLPSVVPDSNYRYIVMLGNSSVFGALSTSDEQCISSHLERILNNCYKAGKRFKVLNLGVGFYNSFQELISFMLYGVKYKPEFVVTFDGFIDIIMALQNKNVPLTSANFYYTKEIFDKVNLKDLKLANTPSFPLRVSYNTDWDKGSKDIESDVIELYKRNLGLICLIAGDNKIRTILTLQPLQVKEDGHFVWWRQREKLEPIYSRLPTAIKEVAERYNSGFINFQEIFSTNKAYNDYFSHTDPVHLIDKGQEIVAQYIFEKIRKKLESDSI